MFEEARVRCPVSSFVSNHAVDVFLVAAVVAGLAAFNVIGVSWWIIIAGLVVPFIAAVIANQILRNADRQISLDYAANRSGAADEPAFKDF
ncbi:MAG TPA: hypothetical protein VEB18_02560 [Candidatus Paceibacterota bacterium]|nr:hypothetical protein [Candidatus Paceibacterota bacterium]